MHHRQLDALVVDARSLKPATALRTEELREMRAAFNIRATSSLSGVDAIGYSRSDSKCTPVRLRVSGCPLRHMIERYGSQAHPSECVTLRCEEIPSLVEVVRHSDAVLLAIRASAPDLVELSMKPALDATAFVRGLMHELLRD